MKDNVIRQERKGVFYQVTVNTPEGELTFSSLRSYADALRTAQGDPQP